MSSHTQTSSLDYIGISLSVLCAIHCTLGPLLILFLPAIGGIFENELFHIGLFLLIMPVAMLTFLRCYKIHKNKLVLYLGVVALVFLLSGLLLGEISETLETSLTVIGSVLITIAHIKNIRHCSCLKSHGPTVCSSEN
jgi:cytochrome c biogenesis factor